MPYSIRNAVAKTRYVAAGLKKLSARQRVIDSERRFLASAAGRRAFPKYERAPEHLTRFNYDIRHQRRMNDFIGYDLKKAFKKSFKYHKSKTRYPKVLFYSRGRPVYAR